MTFEERYTKYRGKCKELAGQLSKEKGYELVRGHYIDPQWGEQPHWWCVDDDGAIHDPTAAQFPSSGHGDYVPFRGVVICSECGNETNEQDMILQGPYPTCSTACAMRFVGL